MKNLTDKYSAVNNSQAHGKDQYIQSLRGIAIAAIVLIHCLPVGQTWVFAVRSFLNFSVALFLFLSGYLTPPNKCVNIKSFYKRRIGKILIPYVIWSIIYILIYGPYTPKRFITGLLLGNSSAQMYYLLVYAQMVILTPFLYRALQKRWAWILWLITPVTLLIKEILAFNDTSIRGIGSFFGSWLIFYLLGLQWRKIRDLIDSIWLIFVCYTVTLAIQIILTFVWSMQGFDSATSQLKLSSMLTSICFICMVMQVNKTAKTRLAHIKILTLLGDCSWGIYLCHIAILIFVDLGLTAIGINTKDAIGSLIIWLITLSLSTMTIHLCQILLPQHAQNWIGCE